jgi:hypothetical protein
MMSAMEPTPIAQGGGSLMKLVRRITIVLASITALAMAGGAHWRAG